MASELREVIEAALVKPPQQHIRAAE